MSGSCSGLPLEGRHRGSWHSRAPGKRTLAASYIRGKRGKTKTVERSMTRGNEKTEERTRTWTNTGLKTSEWVWRDKIGTTASNAKPREPVGFHRTSSRWLLFRLFFFSLESWYSTTILTCLAIPATHLTTRWQIAGHTLRHPLEHIREHSHLHNLDTYRYVQIRKN